MYSQFVWIHIQPIVAFQQYDLGEELQFFSIVKQD